MPSPEAIKAPFACSQYYHVVFKCIDGLLLFQNDLNRIFFLQRLLFFMKPACNCLAYCLLDNHTHFIISVKEKQSFTQSIALVSEQSKTVSMKKYLSNTSNESLVDELIERQFNRFMVSYTNAYNNMYKRKGGLFKSPFSRVLISGDNHLQQAIIYVHANAQKHRLIKDYRSYPHSSFRQILAGNAVYVQATAVLDFFGGIDRFTAQHDLQVAYYYAKNWPASKLEAD